MHDEYLWTVVYYILYMKNKFHTFQSRKRCEEKKKVRTSLLLRVAKSHGLFSIHRTRTKFGYMPCILL